MNVIQIFSTPFWESEFSNFSTHKESFLKCVEKFKENNPESVSKTSVNGYQSPITLTTEPEMSPLLEHVAQIAMKAMLDLQFVDCDVYITAAWANFNKGRNEFNREHVHTDTFSGVFYLQVPEKSGKLNIRNPGINPLWQGSMLFDKKNKFNAESLFLEPVEGHVFLWPSYLSHSVEPNNHDETRISVSFNVICIPKEPIPHTK
jgi:uncharacterized protein (TIGR02466 family)